MYQWLFAKVKKTSPVKNAAPSTSLNSETSRTKMTALCYVASLAVGVRSFKSGDQRGNGDRLASKVTSSRSGDSSKRMLSKAAAPAVGDSERVDGSIRIRLPKPGSPFGRT
jgi:hypothetical protein